MGNTTVEVPTTDLPNATYPFFGRLARMINSGQARSIVFSGIFTTCTTMVNSTFRSSRFCSPRREVPGIVQVVYELNGPVRISDEDRGKLREAFSAWKNGGDA